MQSLYESQDFIDCHDEFRSAFFDAQLQFQVTTDEDVHTIAGTHHHTKDIGLVRGGHDTPFVRFVAVPGVLLTAFQPFRAVVLSLFQRSQGRKFSQRLRMIGEENEKEKSLECQDP